MSTPLKRWEAFWLDRTVEVGRLAALRVVFFGLLGLDLVVLMVEKAYRYGIGDFNVAHFDLLDRALPPPSSQVHTVLYLVAGFLSLRVAAGIAVKASLRLLTVLYAYTYFSSLHDGYQHHYLIAWILLIFWAIPLEVTGGVEQPRIDPPQESQAPPSPKAKGKRKGIPRDVEAPTDAHPPAPRVKSWGASLLYAQVSIVYLFTALTKANANWFNGWALKQQISTPWVRDMLDWMGGALHLPGGGMYAVVATSVFAWQALAALSFVWPRLRAFACVTGPLFHVMVEVIGLEIRWFSYYMIALYYLLLFPDPWYDWLAGRLWPLFAPLRGMWARLLSPVPMARPQRAALTAAGAAGIFALGLSCPLPGSAALGGILAALTLGAERRAGAAGARACLPRLGVQLALAAVVALAPRLSGAAYDYYRQQGGDLARRGEVDAAIDAYEHAVDLNPGPDSRHLKLGQLLMARGRYQEALDVFEAGLITDPGDTHLKDGQEKARRALERTGAR